MSTTPKAVRRAGYCICPWATFHGDEHKGHEVRGRCRYGYCLLVKCDTCHGELWGMGPVACKCDGGPRWARHPAMAERGHWDLGKDGWVKTGTAVKPSITRRNRGRRK